MAERDDLLIAEFNARRSEEAFAGLVRLHVNLVFAAALRQTGDSGIAEEVTQNVFIALAQSAGKLGRHPTIAGWLYQTTINKSRERMRAELRRRHREQTAINLQLASAEGESVWASLVPLLDEALLELREADRLAVILHCMEGQTFREVGSALGVGEEAARKRVSRCLDQLTSFFRQRGFIVSAFATGTSLFTVSSHAAPAGLAASATTTGLAATKVAGTSTLTLYTLMASGKLKIAAGLVIVAGIGTTLMLEHQARIKLRNDNLALQQQIETLGKENQRLVVLANTERSGIDALEKAVVKGKRLSLAEIPTAIQAALKKPFTLHDGAFKEIVASVDPADLPQVAVMLERFSNYEAKTTLRALFLARWAEIAPQAAMAAASATASGPNQHEAILAVAKAWAQADLPSALDWAEKLPVGDKRNDIFQKIITIVADSDPQKAAEMSLQLPGRWQMFTAEKVAAQWVERDPDAALSWVKSLPVGDTQTRALNAISGKLAQANPQAAAELASSLPAGLGKRFLSEIASSWAQSDLPSAIAWAQRLADTDREYAFQNIAQQWTTSDPQAAAAYMLKSQSNSLYTVGSEWGKNDPQAAMRWTKQTMTDEKSRDDMYKAIISGWAAVSPLDAANYVSALPTGPQQNSVAESVVSHWAENDPAAAASWAVGISEEAPRGVAFQNIVLHWGKSDPDATAQWLQTLPKGDSRDTAIVTFASNCLKDYAPSSALAWAQTITSDGVRNNVIENVAKQWLQTDSTAAQTWISSSTLPDKMKTELLRH